MLCPNCKKPDTSAISSRQETTKSSIVRKRHCLCGYEFETVEIPKKIFKKRKVWLNYRFKTYVATRMVYLIDEVTDLDEKIKLLANNVNVVKENRKLKLIVNQVKNRKLKVII